MSAHVWVFHAVDTEGPLFETPEETVARVNRSCGLALSCDRATLDGLKAGTIDVGAAAPAVATLLRYSSFLGDWGELGQMLDRVGAADFRAAHADSFGRPWIYNWHIMDHVGYEINPRRRDIGFNNVFYFYDRWLARNDFADQIGFHFHPQHVYPQAHLSATLYDPSPWLHQSLLHRLIDRGFFPRSFRAGFHSERPDAHAFLEQWIPHDFSNQAIADDRTTAGQVDVDGHRFGDWRRAPTSWGWYHPHHDDHQRPGACRRRIFRCLNVGTRLRCITVSDIDAAFAQAATADAPVWLMVTNHDFRDMAPDVAWLKKHLDAASARAGLPWHIGNIDDTFAAWRAAPVSVRSEWQTHGGLTQLTLTYDAPIFGPQPYLGLRLTNELYRRDNFDIVEPFRRFTYCFDDNTIPIARVDDIVVGTNDRGGNAVVTVLRRDGKNIDR